MPRLKPEEWAAARSDYEVRGFSLREIGRRVGVAESAVRKKAKIEGWQQAKSAHLVDLKVAALKAVHIVEKEKCALPVEQQVAVELEVDARLRENGLATRLRCVTMLKGLELVPDVTKPSEWKDMAVGTARLTSPDAARTNATVYAPGNVLAGLDLNCLTAKERASLEALLEKACPAK